MWTLNPFSDNTFTNLSDQIKEQMESYREITKSSPVPYPLYPEPGGLVPWGTTSNGDVLFWLTASQPDRWPVVINECRTDNYELYEEDMTGFLAKLLGRESVSSIFPDDFPGEAPFFVQLPGASGR